MAVRPLRPVVAIVALFALLVASLRVAPAAASGTVLLRLSHVAAQASAPRPLLEHDEGRAGSDVRALAATSTAVDVGRASTRDRLGGGAPSAGPPVRLAEARTFANLGVETNPRALALWDPPGRARARLMVFLN